MMYDGVITKPPLEEVIEHGWLQKAHKYIDKYLKNGKWIYRYKSKLLEAKTKYNRNKQMPYGDQPELISYKNGKKLTNSRDNGVNPMQDEFRRNTYDRNWTWTFNKTKATKVKVPKSKNIRDRGYSSSRGSGESKRQRNLGTRNVAGSNRHGTTVRIKDPNHIPQFESLSGPADDGYTFTDSGWYWRGKHINNVLDSQNRNSVKIKVYKTKNGRKSKTRR